MVDGKPVTHAPLRGPALGLVAQMLLLTMLAVAAGLNGAGWVVGAASALAVDVGLARTLLRDPTHRLGPATWVTLARATLAVGVAALAAASFSQSTSTALLVSLATGALVLDYVDGQVARRTRTESALGARLDGEVDAFLILAVSVYVAPAYGWWVLLIGAARYLFFAAGRSFDWMRATLPRRDWRKTVTAVQGITLTVAAAGVVPVLLMQAALAVALALLAESFGRDVWWLWRHRRVSVEQTAASPPPGPVRAGISAVLTVVAVVIVWVALVAPNQPNLVTPDAFVRLPIEGVVVVALAVMLPDQGRRVLALLAGIALSLLLVVKILDVGFITAFDRPFNPVDDWSYAPIGVETLRESVGRTRANVMLGGAAALTVLVLVLPTLSMLRLSRVAAVHRRLSLQAIASLGVAWALCWALGVQLVSSAPIASTSAAELAVQEVRTVQAGIRDRARFAQEIRRDRYQYTPGSKLLTALRGKDVLLLVVESYGQVAVQGSSFSPGVDSVLAQGDRTLAASGFSARSGWLTSPTFGGISWLAHSTLQSGVWVNSPTRYDTLMGSHRFTLNQAFSRAGWRTVDDVPSDNRYWSDGANFYHFDKVYNRDTVGYRGPTYAYASMPDQYVYSALQRFELGRRDRPPLFEEVDLVSSHEPWTQIPPLISWGSVGDGSIFYHLPVEMTGNTDVKKAYGLSIQYTMSTLFSFVQHYARKNLVMIVLGDHQPAKIVSGEDPTHDVPISIISHNRSVLNAVGRWGWNPGMRPARGAPVWPMSAFRNRFLSAFGSTPG
jgi:phosphatidylglycerophosphate synthase